MPNQSQLVRYAITAAIVLLVLVLRTRAMRRERPLKLEQLWIVPALYGAVALYLFWHLPPHGRGWLWVALAFAAGAAIGWWRGTQMTIRIDPETHRLNQKGSALAIAAVIVLVAFRVGLRDAAARGIVTMDVATLTDALVASALGLFAMTRLEMYLRARRMLAAMRSGTPA